MTGEFDLWIKHTKPHQIRLLRLSEAPTPPDRTGFPSGLIRHQAALFPPSAPGSGRGYFFRATPPSRTQKEA